jgi:tripartite-type tricarboxylate transporter receptor subunit TctC
MNAMNFRVALAAIVLSAWIGNGAEAGWAPTKPLTIVVPFSAGGVNDIVTRAMATRLAPLIGQPVIVENRTGAAGVLAMTSVAKATPDGLTLIMGCSACLTINPHLPATTMPIDPLTAFEPVTFVARSPLMLVANPKLPIQSLGDLVRLAKEQPGKLSYGTIGAGSITHLAAALLESSAGIKMLNVPYRGSGGGALSDAIGGQVDVLFDAPETAGVQVKAGNLRLLAVTGERRMQAWPDAPAIAESYPGYKVELWFALLAPAKTPPDAVAFLNRHVRTILADPDFQAPFRKRGLETIGSSPAELHEIMASDSEKWKRVIHDANIVIK